MTVSCKNNYKKHGKVDYIDYYIGKKVRLRRLLLGYSQEKIAKAVGMSIQQVQKYEKGTNRISGGNLYRIGKALDVPVSYFFENVEDNIPKTALSLSVDGDSISITDEREIFSLVKSYNSIVCPQARKKIVALMTAMQSLVL